jgi:ABC-type amino acid transport system permease subunit
MFAIGQDAAINNANLSPLTAVGLVYLALTVPATYAVNAWDRRIRGGRSTELAEAD